MKTTDNSDHFSSDYYYSQSSYPFGAAHSYSNANAQDQNSSWSFAHLASDARAAGGGGAGGFYSLNDRTASQQAVSASSAVSEGGASMGGLMANNQHYGNYSMETMFGHSQPSFNAFLDPFWSHAGGNNGHAPPLMPQHGLQQHEQPAEKTLHAQLDSLSLVDALSQSRAHSSAFASRGLAMHAQPQQMAPKKTSWASVASTRELN
jgi:hypothetical protein